MSHTLPVIDLSNPTDLYDQIRGAMSDPLVQELPRRETTRLAERVQRLRAESAEAALDAARQREQALSHELELAADSFRDLSNVLRLIGENFMSAAADIAERHIREHLVNWLADRDPAVSGLTA